jgi:hypothetical protein
MAATEEDRTPLLHDRDENEEEAVARAGPGTDATAGTGARRGGSVSRLTVPINGSTALDAPGKRERDLTCDEVWGFHAGGRCACLDVDVRPGASSKALEYVGFGRFQLRMLVLCGLCWMAVRGRTRAGPCWAWARLMQQACMARRTRPR